MATLANKETNIRAVLGERVQSFWLSTEIQQWYLDGQNEVLDRVPPDSLKNLFRTFTQSFDGSTSLFTAPTSNIILERVNLQVHESDGDYGDPWNMVVPEVLQQIQASEGDLAQDSTDTRVFCVNALSAGSSVVETVTTTDVDRGYLLYPTPASGRTGRLSFIVSPSESGTLTLPSALQRIAEYFAIARAASKKSRDLDMASRHDQLFERSIERINARYAGKWGLNQGNRIFITDTIGYDNG